MYGTCCLSSRQYNFQADDPLRKSVVVLTSGHRQETIYELQKPQTLQHEAVDLPRSVQRCLSAGECSDQQEEVRMLERQVRSSVHSRQTRCMSLIVPLH